MTTVIRTVDYDAVMADMRATERAIRDEAIRALRARGITRPEPHEVTHEMRRVWIDRKDEARR